MESRLLFSEDRQAMVVYWRAKKFINVLLQLFRFRVFKCFVQSDHTSTIPNFFLKPSRSCASALVSSSGVGVTKSLVFNSSLMKHGNGPPCNMLYANYNKKKIVVGCG